VLANNNKYHKRARFHISDAIEEYQMSQSPSATTSGMNVQSSAVAVQRAAATEQTGVLEGAPIRTGSKSDSVRAVSPNDKAVDSGTTQGFATDADGGNVSARPIDCKVIAGSGGAGRDTRAQAQQPDPLKGNDNGPRADVGQFKGQRNLNTPPTAKTVTPDESVGG
jgi:hypothetical protein